MLIYLLLAGFVAMLYWVYKEFDNDIVCPNFLLVSGYVLSILCATANIKAWAIDLHWQTLGVLFYGTSLFVGTGYLVRNYMRKRYAGVDTNFTENGGELLYNKKYVKWFLAFQVLVLALWIGNIFYQTSMIGEYKTFAERMVAFRKWNSYSNLWLTNISYNFINQFNQISTISAYLVLYVFANNIMWRKKLDFNEDAPLLGILGMVIVQMLMTGGRGGIIALVVAFTILSLVFYRKYNGFVYALTLKRFLFLVIVMCLGAIGFYLTKVIVGRGSDISFSNFLPYMTMYAGGPIQLLDMFLQNPLQSSEIFGKETFYNINFLLARLGLADFDPYIIHLEFRYATTGAFLGNIYTSYRSYIYDFGYVGLTVLPVIFSVIVNWIYYKIIYKGVHPKLDIALLFYSTIGYPIFADFVRCFFYTGVFSVGCLKRMIILIILGYIFLGDLRIKERARTFLGRK